MNYQEILEELKWNSCSYAEEDCYNCNVEDKQSCSNMRILCKQAAKMMEELKRERDELFFMVTNDMVPRRMFEQVIKQRDEAIVDLKEICMERYLPAACDYCNKHGKQVCKHCDWEWRGVRR